MAQHLFRIHGGERIMGWIEPQALTFDKANINTYLSSFRDDDFLLLEKFFILLYDDESQIIITIWKL